MEKINIAQLLKDCPKGMELECSMFDNVTFVRVDTSRKQFPIEIVVSGRHSKYLTKEGCFHDTTLLPEAKCIIFPKGKTTWEGFHRPFVDGDIVAFDTPHNDTLQLFIFKNKKENDTLSSCYLMLDGDELDLEEGMYYVTRLATEEEKEKLFDAIKAKGYCWNPKTKTLEKTNDLPFKIGDRITNGIVTGKIRSRDVDSYQLDNDVFVLFSTLEKWKLDTSKFDINTLVPFESKVLVRDANDYKWKPAIWGFYDEDAHAYPYEVVGGGHFNCCIPYEDNEHLRGTTDDCDAFYKTWEG